MRALAVGCCGRGGGIGPIWPRELTKMRRSFSCIFSTFYTLIRPEFCCVLVLLGALAENGAIVRLDRSLCNATPHSVQLSLTKDGRRPLTRSQCILGKGQPLGERDGNSLRWTTASVV